MNEAMKKEADRRFQEAVDATGARDPRDFYREALRELRGASPEGYDRAVTHFQSVLVPSIASGEADPLEAWRQYGCLLAEATAPGRTVAIDETGLAEPFTADAPTDRLVLHVPDGKGPKAILVSLPAAPSAAQRATFDLLVQGKLRIPGE